MALPSVLPVGFTINDIRDWANGLSTDNLIKAIKLVSDSNSFPYHFISLVDSEKTDKEIIKLIEDSGFNSLMKLMNSLPTTETKYIRVIIHRSECEAKSSIEFISDIDKFLNDYKNKFVEDVYKLATESATDSDKDYLLNKIFDIGVKPIGVDIEIYDFDVVITDKDIEKNEEIKDLYNTFGSWYGVFEDEVKSYYKRKITGSIIHIPSVKYNIESSIKDIIREKYGITIANVEYDSYDYDDEK